MTQIVEKVVLVPFDYANALNNCGHEIETALVGLGKKYAAELESMQLAFQKAGKLEHALTVKNEIRRFDFEKRLADNHLVPGPQELKNLQRKYITAPQPIREDVARTYLRRLEAARNELTVAGKLEEATVAQKQIDAISQKYLAHEQL